MIHGFDVHELMDAEEGKFASVAGMFHAADGSLTSDLTNVFTKTEPASISREMRSAFA